jgi:hypothetical protein
VVTPPPLAEAGIAEVPAMRRLTRSYLDELVSQGLYTADEMAAMEDPTAECSWRPEVDRYAGPLATVAVSAGRVVGGVYLFQNQRDHYWFLDVLIRDPAAEYRGVGFDVVRGAASWFKQYAADGWQLRVHSMTRETNAAAWWTRYVGRAPDFADAFIRTPKYFFPAFGWVMDRGWPA